jgi:hypothetical protein
MSSPVTWFVLVLAMISSIGLILSHDWRWLLAFLATQYFCAFWMIQTHWPVSMAAAKLVTGWMACAVLGIAQLNAYKSEEKKASHSQGRLFRFFTAAMVVAVTFAGATRLTAWLAIDLPIAWASLLLLGLGLLHLGVTSDPFRVVIGLLSILSGFEIVYAMVESSILVTALLAIVNLGLALTGAYFLTRTQEEEA